MNVSLNDIARIVSGTVIGNDAIMISGLAPIDHIQPNTIVFAEGDDNLKRAEASQAAAILVAKHVNTLKKALIQVDNPFKAFMQLLQHFYPAHPAVIGIHPTAAIAEDARIGERVSIGAFVSIQSGTTIGNDCVIKSHVSIGHQVSIGPNTTIHPHVTVYDKSQIGQRVCIHAGSVIGSDGFGYTYENGQHTKVPHVGFVAIEDDVEIGASTMIDRATLGSTVIGQGTKIDNADCSFS